MTIYVCSSNTGKLREFSLTAQRANLANIRIEPLPKLRSIAPPEERGSTFEENAIAKALFYSAYASEPVLADDSGLEVDALNGAPGVYSARYAGPEASDNENSNVLLRNLANAAHREARFVCVLALAQRGELLTTSHGVAEGTILVAPRGAGGFGYDPLFWYAPLERSFAELTPEEKFSVSHRGKAVRTLLERLPDVLKSHEG